MTQVVSRSGEEVTMEVAVRLNGSLMDIEAAILEALGRFDTDESAIRVGALELTARGATRWRTKPPYGVVEIERYLYQTSRGGRINCPWSTRPESFAERRRASPASSATRLPSSMRAPCSATWGLRAA